MKRLMIAASLCFSLPALADLCAPHMSRDLRMRALETLSARMDYSLGELCSHPRLLDIHVTETNFYNPATREHEPSEWVTLHYREFYACQYYVRQADMVVTKQNCYSTF